MNRYFGVTADGPRALDLGDQATWVGEPTRRPYLAASILSTPTTGRSLGADREHFQTAFAAHHWGRSWRGADGVRAGVNDVLPDDWSDFVIKTTSLGHAALTRSARLIKSRVAQPSKRRLKDYSFEEPCRTEAVVHGIPWGSDHVLVATPLGTRLLLPVQDISLAPELALTGVYDKSFIDFLARSLRPGMTFVDVGANVGLFTVVGAMLVGAGGRVFAYECNPRLVECLRRSIQMNWFNDRVVVVPKAAGRDSNPTKFWMSDRLAGLGSTVPGNPLHSNNTDVVELEVASESLDERLADAAVRRPGEDRCGGGGTRRSGRGT